MARSNAALRLVEPSETVDRAISTTGGSRTASVTNLDRFRPSHIWLNEVFSRICPVLQMDPGWDGNGAPIVRRDAGMFVLEILSQVMTPQTPLPQIVPTSVGGIQVEWHERDIDLEFHVAAPYRCELWFEDHTGQNALISIELTSDFSEFRNAVAALTQRT